MRGMWLFTLLPKDTSHDNYNMSDKEWFSYPLCTSKATLLRFLPIVDTPMSDKVTQEGEALVT